MPQGFCGTVATSCGYTGKDCQSYFGTYPEPPFAAVVRGLGLVIQATHAEPGDTKYYDNQMADIQSYGKITIHPGSFVEWEARMPTDLHGEGMAGTSIYGVPPSAAIVVKIHPRWMLPRRS
jgi:hypothetical protein